MAHGAQAMGKVGRGVIGGWGFLEISLCLPDNEEFFAEFPGTDALELIS